MKTLLDVFNSMNSDQKKLLYFITGTAAETGSMEQFREILEKHVFSPIDSI